jgi:plasmid stabilization system protein ParE
MPAEYRLHRRVIDDIKEAESYYLQEGGSQLADKFFDEIVDSFEVAAEHPSRAHFNIISHCRRVNLANFPYHFLYDSFPGYIHIFVFRHNRRHPTFGLRRKR